MNTVFRELLQKVGSGEHTHKNLTRAEAAQAATMILLEQATPAQIGAFLIAHRIKRPTSEELAGMLDAYDQLGPQLPMLALPKPLVIFGCPYDGRSRTAPVIPLTALVLAAAGCPVLMHGGDRSPTKYGIPLVEVWRLLGVKWQGLNLEQLQHRLEQTLVGFLYTPDHFPLTQQLMTYRDQIGKRPPFATLELMWSPYRGEAHVVSGFVHPPTETTMRGAFALRGVHHFTTVKGLEGSCDVPRNRSAILGRGEPWERIILNAYDYDMAGSEVDLPELEIWPTLMQQTLAGVTSDLTTATLWNSGLYLWHLGFCSSPQEGFAWANELLSSGKTVQKLQQLQNS
jgi:anthranilate phosphoribosyltransferase